MPKCEVDYLDETIEGLIADVAQTIPAQMQL